MNIFYLDHDVDTCAKYHNTKHTIKMILEQHQLLSTAHRILDGSAFVESRNRENNKTREIKRYKLEDERENLLYKATHVKHPSAIWVRMCDENYNWLYNMTVSLCKEYTYRYGKIHKCEEIGLLKLLNKVPNNIPKGKFTEPTPAMPKECIIPGNSIASYRNYYITYKQHLACWDGKLNNRKAPEWYIWTT